MTWQAQGYEIEIKQCRVSTYCKTMPMIQKTLYNNNKLDFLDGEKISKLILF